MSDSLGWTSNMSSDITYEEGLALIDHYYEDNGIPASPDTPDIVSKSKPTFDNANATSRAQAADKARTAAAIAQVARSPPVGPSKISPILPSSPPHDQNPQWPADASVSFLPSPTAITTAPLPTPVASFSNPMDFVHVTTAPHIASIPSPLQSPTTPPIAPITTSTPAPTAPATAPMAPATAPMAPATAPMTPATAPTAPATAPPKPNTTSTTAKSTTKPTVASNKAAKKTTTDTPHTPATTTTTLTNRNVKKQRCTRCVRQHGACNIDVQHPCQRCTMAGLPATDCVPRPERQPGTAAAAGARRKSSSAATAAAAPSTTTTGTTMSPVLVSARPNPGAALSWQL